MQLGGGRLLALGWQGACSCLPLGMKRSLDVMRPFDQDAGCKSYAMCRLQNQGICLRCCAGIVASHDTTAEYCNGCASIIHVLHHCKHLKRCYSSTHAMPHRLCCQLSTHGNCHCTGAASGRLLSSVHLETTSVFAR